MQYTIFELERIEKVLHQKLEESQEAYDNRYHLLLRTFKQDNDIPSNPISESGIDMIHKWQMVQDEDIDLVFLWGEVDLFKRGIHSLYSYWNSSVEIFIDKMRTHTKEDYPENERKPVIDPNGEGEHDT